MFRRLDAWLIDKAFQPAADRLARWWSCYEVAAFLLTGSLFLLVAIHVQQSHWVGIALVSVYFPGGLVEVYRKSSQYDATMEAKPHFVVFNGIFRRFCVLPPAFVEPILLLPPLSLHSIGYFVSDLLMFIGCYFLACTPRPPRRRASFVPSLGATAGS